MHKALVLVGSIFCSMLLSNNSFAEQELSGAEIKALLNDVTFMMENHLKGGQGWGYTNSDGTYIKKKRSGKKKKQSWNVDELGRFCKRGKRLNCGKLYKAGEDEYHWYMNGEHTHTLSHFQKGNQL